MKRIRISDQLLVSGTSLFLEQLAWPQAMLPVLLGPSFLLGIDSLLKITQWQYFATMLASALTGFLTGGYPLAGIIVLHFCLWRWAHNLQQNWPFALSIALPLVLMLLLHTERGYLTYLLALGSASCQLILYRTLTNITLHKLKALKKRHYSQQGANRLLLATTQWQQLDQLEPLIQELSDTVEQTYDIYQNLEIISRTSPNLPSSLAQRLLTASQLVHQNKLQLHDWREQQEQALQEFVGREMVSLRTACEWVSTHIAYIGSKNGQAIETLIDLPEDRLLTSNEQLPLAALLLFICQRGLEESAGQQISFRLNGYMTGDGIRVIMAFAPKSNQPSGEWPELSPYDLGSAADYAKRLNACAKKGVTSKGEYVYTLEMG